MQSPFVTILCLLGTSALAAAAPINWSIYLSDSNSVPALTGTVTYDAATQSISTWSILGFDGFSGNNPCTVGMPYPCAGVGSSASNAGSTLIFSTLTGSLEQDFITLALTSALPNTYGKVNLIPGMQTSGTSGFGVTFSGSSISDGRAGTALTGYLVSSPEPSPLVLVSISMLGMLAWRIRGQGRVKV